MGIKALMIDVDGVLVNGRPHDGRHWSASLEEDLGLSPERLQREFFAPFWEDIVLGRAALMDYLAPFLERIAPHVVPERFIAYWFQQDSRLAVALLQEISLLRSEGIRVYLATNQEHMRAAYLMQKLGLSNYLDGIYYSAQLGVKKPDGDFFASVCSHAGFDARELLLVDDSRQNIDAAVAAGWNALHWNSGCSPELIRTSLAGKNA